MPKHFKKYMFQKSVRSKECEAVAWTNAVQRVNETCSTNEMLK